MVAATATLAIDIGGTFIDAVLFDPLTGQLTASKWPTRPDDPAGAVLAAIAALDVSAERLGAFVHGTTLGLNAILERRGGRVGIITNEGFSDLFEIARGSLEFADMYRFDYAPPPPLVERRHTRGVAGRMNYAGEEVTPLDEEAVVTAARELVALGCDAIAVSFLHAYANGAHEEAAVAAIAMHLPDVPVSAGASLANEYREYERTSTAVLDAYIKPVLRRYLSRLNEGLADAGFAGRKTVMNSAGGAVTFALAEAKPIVTVLSGPAGGVAGALRVAEATGRPNVLSIDVGGTSLDACLIVEGAPVEVFEARIDTFPVLQPIFDLRTLGAGGGSIAYLDNKLLRVGPQSAGAVPGPAAYGRGGTLPTVTDAALVLGYLDATNFMGGEMALALELAENALLEHIAGPLEVTAREAARAIFDVIIARTASSVREMMLERGLDPRDFSLLAFGGCGPLFGPMLFAELQMAELVIPPLPSVFSAWGMLASDLTFTDTASVLEPVAEPAMPRVRRIAAELAARADAAFVRSVSSEAVREAALTVRVRFVGQEHTVSVAFDPAQDAAALFSRFSEAHQSRFGHTFTAEAEITALIVRLTSQTQKPPIGAPEGAACPPGTPHRMNDPATGRTVECRRMRREALTRGSAHAGPLLVTDEGSSLAVSSAQTLSVDPFSMLVVTGTEASP